jgi:hypothetical protein
LASPISHGNLLPDLPLRGPREGGSITPDRQSLSGSHQQSWWFYRVITPRPRSDAEMAVMPKRKSHQVRWGPLKVALVRSDVIRSHTHRAPACAQVHSFYIATAGKSIGDWICSLFRRVGNRSIRAPRLRSETDLHADLAEIGCPLTVLRRDSSAQRGSRAPGRLPGPPRPGEREAAAPAPGSDHRPRLTLTRGREFPPRALRALVTQVPGVVFFGSAHEPIDCEGEIPWPRRPANRSGRP